jgi:hypothetical protein
MPDIIERPGIYFGLDEDVYHASPWCGSTDMKKLFRNPPDFWEDSWFNEHREPEGLPTPAQRYGRAIHSCILYGRKQFDLTHRGIDDETGETVSADGVKSWLKDHGTQPKKLKDECLQQVKDEFGVELLTGPSYFRIVAAHASITANPYLQPAFSGGWPEVSVFWEQDGVPCKCRIDYLKMRASVDLKSFVIQDRVQPLDTILKNIILRYRYDMQLAHYQNGRRAMQQLAEEGLIYGTVRPDLDWLLQCAACEDPAFVLVFYSKQGAPIAKAIQVKWKQALHMSGQASLSYAIEAYLKNFGLFGTERWVNIDPPKEFLDEDLPAYLW